MAQHILLEYAYRYDIPKHSDIPEECTFHQSKGYWVSNLTGQAMMESDRPKPSITKKHDRETGEDQKGE